MKLEYFTEFVTLAESKNFWEASERLYMNQSTLSKHIKAMEEELGVSLFVRTTRRVELTDFGKTLLPYASTISESYFEYSTALLRLKSQDDGLVTIGTLPSMARYKITDLLLNYQKEFPNYNTSIIEADTNDLQQMLIDKKCELAFLREKRTTFEQGFLKDEQLTRIPYCSDYMVAVIPNSNPFSKLTEISLQKLKDTKLCFLKKDTFLYDLCRSACLESNFIPNIVFDSHRIESILDMVTKGDNYIGLLMNQHVYYPEFSSYEEHAPFTPVKIVPPITTQISVCYLKNEPLSQGAKHFIQYLEKVHFKNFSISNDFL